MEEQKRENKEELQQETAEEKNSGQGNSSTRSSLLWIFAGGYLVYTGYRLCASVISGAEDSGVVFLAAGGIFVVIGAVLLIMAIRNLAKAGAQKHELEEAAAKKAAEEAFQVAEEANRSKLLKIRKPWQRKKCQLRSGRILRKIWMTHRRRKTKNKTGCR